MSTCSHADRRKTSGDQARLEETELIARIRLNTLLPRHPTVVSDLMRLMGNASSVLQASPDQLSVAGTPRAQVADILACRSRGGEVRDRVERQVEMSLKWRSEPDQAILTPGYDGWPSLLSEIYDPPVLLYARGDVRCLDGPCFAVVGSRNTSHQDRELSTMLAAQLSRFLCIVSGLALGVDAAAHRGAVSANRRTCAVLGHGCDLVYPRRHQKLADEIVAQSGVLISSFPVGLVPQPIHFPQRNRIVTGLSLGTLVVAAQKRSGSMISARLALEQGRLVFAVPGSIADDRHGGCHQLIRDGAALVTSPADILQELGETGWVAFRASPGDAPSVADKTVADETSPQNPDSLRDRLLLLLSDRPMSMDEIRRHFPREDNDITTILVALEIEGDIVRLPGGYVRGVDGGHDIG